MAEDEDRSGPAGDEFIPYGSALGHVLRANPGMIKEEASARLLEACETGQIRVRSGKSARRQARVEVLKERKAALLASRWHTADLEREFPTKPQSAASEKGSTPKQSPSVGGGAPTKYGWEEVAVCFGAWFYERTGPQPAP